MTDARWIELDGAVNVRDLGGLPTADGRAVQPRPADPLGQPAGALPTATSSCSSTRSACARSPTCAPASRSTHEGPGPLTEVDDVDVVHLSLFPESGDTDRRRRRRQAGDPAVAEPRRSTIPASGRGRPGSTCAYLDDRADSIVAALRLIAGSPGATIVHCAAGKDRTGTVVAIALAEVGVTREAIVADYARSAERIEAIFDRLRATRTYAEDIGDADAEQARAARHDDGAAARRDGRGVRRPGRLAARARLDRRRRRGPAPQAARLTRPVGRAVMILCSPAATVLSEPAANRPRPSPGSVSDQRGADRCRPAEFGAISGREWRVIFAPLHVT